MGTGTNLDEMITEPTDVPSALVRVNSASVS